jgi:hypothetical protein
MADIMVKNKATGELVPFPEGTSPEAIANEMRRRFPAGVSEPRPRRATAPPEEELGPVESFMEGAADPFQEMSHMAHGFSPSTDREIQQREERLQRRHISGPARFLGSAATTTGLGALTAGSVGAAVPAAGRMLGSAVGQGAIGGALQPTTSNHPVIEKVMQTALGAGGGKLLGGIAEYSAGRIAPKTPDELSELGKQLQREVITDLGGDPARQLSRQGQYSLNGRQANDPRFRGAVERKWNQGIEAQRAAWEANQKLVAAAQSGVPDVSTLKAIIATIGHFTHTKGGTIASTGLNAALDHYFDQSAPAALRQEAADIIRRAGITRDRNGTWFMKNLDVFAPQLGTLAGETVDYPVAPDPLRPNPSSPIDDGLRPGAR